MGRRLEKKTIRFVTHVFWAYLDHSLSDISKSDQKTRAKSVGQNWFCWKKHFVTHVF